MLAGDDPALQRQAAGQPHGQLLRLRRRPRRTDLRREHRIIRTMTCCHLCNIALMLGRELKWDPDEGTVRRRLPSRSLHLPPPPRRILAGRHHIASRTAHPIACGLADRQRQPHASLGRLRRRRPRSPSLAPRPSVRLLWAEPKTANPACNISSLEPPRSSRATIGMAGHEAKPIAVPLRSLRPTGLQYHAKHQASSESIA